MKITVLAGLCAGLLLAAGGASADATSDALSKAGYDVVACRTHDETQEKADHDLVVTALQMLQQRNIAGAKALLPQLRAAQARSPDAPFKPELCGTTINIYSDQITDLLVVSGLLSKDPALSKLSAALKGSPPYGSISYVLGWMEYEDHDYNAALADYSRGRLNAPDDVAIASEYSSTLSALGRSQDSYDAAAAFLIAHPMISDHEKAILMRREGYALVDLGKLDDAEKAYGESLKLDPSSTVAKGELDYIKQQKAKH